MTSELVVRGLVLAVAAQQLAFPFFVNPFSQSAGAIRGGEPSQLEPAGYAFLIWTPIYLLALAFGVWQLTAAGRAAPVTLKIAPFAITLFAGSSAWLWFAKYGPLWMTMPTIAVMAACAVACLLLALGSGPRTGIEWLCLVLPFGLYAGWTLCATFVNVAEVAPQFGFTRFGLSVPGFAVLSIIVAGMLAGLLVWRTQANIPFTAAIVWALVGIVVAGVTRGADRAVVATAAFAAIAVAALFVFIRISQRTAT
jgi:uncharacterized membrane protein